MRSEITAVLRKVPIFEHLSEQELGLLKPLFAERKFGRGDVIFWQGDEADDFYIVKQGLVKFYRPLEDKEIILELIAEGGFFGDPAIFSKEMRRSANAEAIEATVVYVLSREQLFAFLHKNPSAMQKLLTNMSERYRRAGDMLESLTGLDVRRRLYRLLLQLADEYGNKQDQGQVAIGIRLTHLQLANMIGTVRETITKVMTELHEEGIVTSDCKTLVLSEPDKLREKLEPAECTRRHRAI